DRRQLGERLAERRELGRGLGDPLELGLDTSAVPLGDVALAPGDVEPVRDLPRLLPRTLHRLPAREDLGAASLGFTDLCFGIAERRRRLLATSFRRLPLLLQRLRVRQPRAQPLDLVAPFVPARPRPLLGHTEPLLAEHLPPEATPPRGAHLRQELELLLPGEVGVEESLAAHPEPPREVLGHAAERRRHRRRPAVEEDFRVVHRPHDAVLVPRQLEDQLDLDTAATRRTGEADRVVRPARGRRAVDGPRDRFQDRALPRSVRADDPGQPGPELDLGLGVLTEVEQAQADQAHRPLTPRPTPTPPARPPARRPPPRPCTDSRARPAGRSRSRRTCAASASSGSCAPPPRA